MDELQLAEALERVESRLAKLEESRTDSTESSAKSSASEDAAKLEEELARLQSPEHQVEVVRDWAIGLDYGAYLELGRQLGHVLEASADEGKAAEAKQAEEAREAEEPGVVVGRKEGYQFLDLFGVSIKES